MPYVSPQTSVPATPRRRWTKSHFQVVFAGLLILGSTSLLGCDTPLGEIIGEIGHHPPSGGGGQTSPCDTVRCAAGTHCEAHQVQCIKAPCPPVAECVPDAPSGPACGGIAGRPCPGMGRCADDPTDSCDPQKGGADCGGICTCIETVACVKGSKFDSSPNVCACVPEKPVCGPVCDIFCQYGNVLDSQGCPTCKCNPAPTGMICPPEKCTGPGPKSPTVMCADGTTAGPTCMTDAAGACNWTVTRCP